MFTTRQRKLILLGCAVGLLFASLLPVLVHAETTVRYDQTNFWTLEHEVPATFTRTTLGGFYGYTTSGRMFRQEPVLAATTDVRLHRFEIDDAFFYISDRGIITATSDLGALSIYHTRPA